MRWTGLTASLLLLTLTTGGAQTITGAQTVTDAQATTAGEEPDHMSLTRIRAALERPAPPTLVPAEPPVISRSTFSMRIVEDRLFERSIPMPWQVDPMLRPRQWMPVGPFGTQPLAGIDLMWLTDVIAQRVNRIRHARAEAAATREVLQTIRDYCDAKPDSGAGIRICRP